MRVMAVTFERHGLLHYLAVDDDASYRVGDHVLHPTEAGPEVCQVVWAPEWASAVDGFEVPRCAGPASDDDLSRDREQRAERAQAEAVARELIARHELPMKVVAVDVQHDVDGIDTLVAVWFTAPGRVDFRALVGDLARALRAKVDLRQIASREQTMLLGGIGSCGRELCCSTWKQSFEPVGMRLARDQRLNNPLQIQGQCGKLKCCLAYEHELYTDFEREAPAMGSRIEVSQGSGTVVGHHVPAQSVVVRLASGETIRCPLSEVCSSRVRKKPRHSKREQS